MPRLVNLDALIPREDFEIQEASATPSLLGVTIKASELESSNLSYQALRKPDFQRETASWEPEKIADLVASFLRGDLIPSLILWRSPQSGNIFVIDGAHRLSALIAWIQDDYGDGVTSRRFFQDNIPKEQLEAAQETRALLSKSIGSYADVRLAGSSLHALPERVFLARNLSSFAVSLQWVQGDAKSAESSFFKINQKATPIDPTELRMLKSRHKPNALAARALIRSGVGHKYWSDFGAEEQKQTERIAKEIYDSLFEPELQTPIKTLDLPIAGRGYSAESVRLLFEFVNLANGVVREAQEKELAEDHAGAVTVQFLKNVRRIASRISGKDPGSLGLHPAVYFYGATGRRQPTAFLATATLMKALEQRDGFKSFTDHRARFEEFLLTNRDFTNQIVRKYGSGLKGSGTIHSLYEFILVELRAGKSDEAIVNGVMGQFTFLREYDQTERSKRGAFSGETKSAVFLKTALETATRCAICGARLHRNAISVDHIVRKADGGTADLDNAQLSHPYCNTGYKESKVHGERSSSQRS